MSIPSPSNDWISKPLPLAIKPGHWNNFKQYDNFLSKRELRERSRQRGLIAMIKDRKFERIKLKLEAKQKLSQDLRSEAQWTKHHESGERKHWRTKS